MTIKNYLWLLPFCSFILGYGITQWFFTINSMPTPYLVGSYVHEILPLLSEKKLNLRVINQKEESHIPAGIIISQTPQAGKAIKPHQPIFVIITKKPLATKAPQCITKHIDTLIPELQKINIYPRIYKLTHPFPEGICFAQFPESEEFLEKNRLILYISSGNNKPIIWPDLIGISLEDAIHFLDSYTIKPYIINDTPYLQTSIDTYTIIDQRPIAGTLITLDEKQPLSVQLRIH